MLFRSQIVRALVHDPALLLMDEPFGALDALTREQMRVDLEALWLSSPKTVLFITHSIDEAVLLSDRVVVMGERPGRIDRILPIDLPRPRGLEARESAGVEPGRRPGGGADALRRVSQRVERSPLAGGQSAGSQSVLRSRLDTDWCDTRHAFDTKARGTPRRAWGHRERHRVADPGNVVLGDPAAEIEHLWRHE